MDRSGSLTDLQVDLATMFFALAESKDFVVAGGAALVASRLIDRPTQDIDLFAGAPTNSVGQAQAAFTKAARQQGCEVVVIHEADTFCRMVLTRAGERTIVDLAIDSPPRIPSTMTVLGPTLAPIELAGRKLLALFGRAEARDFADVYLLAQQFGTEQLLHEARELDPGFTHAVLAQMLSTMTRFDDSEIPLAGDDLTSARAFFAGWAEDLSDH